MSPTLAELERLLALYELMTRAAEAQDWESLASQDTERAALVEKLPDNLVTRLPPAEQIRARALIENCLRCEARIRPEILNRLGELRVLLREPQAAPK